MRSHAMLLSRGFSLFAALFIILVVGLLAASIFRLNQVSNVAVAQQVLSTRALFAAESGLQTAAMRAFPLGGAPVCSNFSINFTNPGLVGCRVQVGCSEYTAGGETFFEVTSRGECGATTELAASRTLEGLFSPL